MTETTTPTPTPATLTVQLVPTSNWESGPAFAANDEGVVKEYSLRIDGPTGEFHYPDAIVVNCWDSRQGNHYRAANLHHGLGDLTRGTGNLNGKSAKEAAGKLARQMRDQNLLMWMVQPTTTGEVK